MVKKADEAFSGQTTFKVFISVHAHIRRGGEEEATLTYLTDELYVRGRPVERFREYIKVKRLYDIPAETGTKETGQ